MTIIQREAGRNCSNCACIDIQAQPPNGPLFPLPLPLPPPGASRASWAEAMEAEGAVPG